MKSHHFLTIAAHYSSFIFSTSNVLKVLIIICVTNDFSSFNSSPLLTSMPMDMMILSFSMFWYTFYHLQPSMHNYVFNIIKFLLHNLIVNFEFNSRNTKRKIHAKMSFIVRIVPS